MADQKLHSDSDENVGRVGADNGEAQAEIRTPTSSAVRPHFEDHIDSSEDEVVWKGRLKLRNIHPSTKRRTKASSIPGAEPSFDRRSEAAKNKMTAPGYSYPYSSAFYQPYAQSFRPYSPSYPSIYPPAYPPAYPQFYVSPGPYKIPNPITQNGLAQQNPRNKEQSNVVHLDDRAGLETTITRNGNPRTRSVTFSSETATTGKKRPNSKRKKSKLTNENRPKADSKFSKELAPSSLTSLSLSSSNSRQLIDEAHSHERATTIGRGDPIRAPSIDKEQSDYAVSGGLSYEDSISLSRDNNDIWDENVVEPVVEGPPPPPEPEPPSPLDGEKPSDWGLSSTWGASKKTKKIKRKKNQFVEPDSTSAALSEPIIEDAPSVGQSVAIHSGSRDHPLYPNVGTASVLPSTLHRSQCKLLDEVNPEPIIEEDANRSHVPHLAIEDAQSMLKDATIHESFSQRAPRIDLAGEHIVRRATHTNPNGLVISVTIPSSYAAFHSQFSISPEMKWPESKDTDGDINMDVKKAISAKRLRRRDGAYSMELYCDKGPTSSKNDSTYQMQWLHMKTRRLNLAEFENACLNAPGLSGEARFTLLRLFKQIQAKHRKQLFDGYLIEPGTVLRCDGVSPGDANVVQPSAIFICFPYLSVGTRQEPVRSAEPGYPTRSILQTLYPYESTTFSDEAPSFCSDRPQSADQVLYAPQCWIIVLNSDTLVSCAELGSGAIINPIVSLSHQKKSFSPTVGHKSQKPGKNAAVNGLDPMKSAQAVVQQSLEGDEYDRDLRQLFEEIRVEDYLVEDDESDTSSITSTSQSSLKDADVGRPPEARDNLARQERNTAEYSSAIGCGPAVHSDIEKRGNPEMLLSIQESVRSDADPETMKKVDPLYDLHKSEVESLSLTVEGATKAEASMLAFLHSLECPQMTTKYLAEFRMYMNYVLDLWSKAPSEAQRRQHVILTRLKEGITCAELLSGMCDLESQGSVFSENHGFRDAMLAALGIENSSSQEQLESLGTVVRDAMTLFKGISDSKTTAAIKSARKILRDQSQATKPVNSQELQLSEPTSGLALNPVKPFLTWMTIDAGLNERDIAEQVTAEYLDTIMGEIENSLMRNDDSYKFAREVAISKLESSLAAPMQHSATTSNIGAPGQQRVASRHESVDIASQILPSLGTILQNLPPDDALVRAQKNEVRAAIDDLFTCLKRFIGLYVACDYSHTTATQLFQEHEHTKLLYIVRPLESGFLRTHKIKKPADAIESCPACKDGQTYKSHQEAMSHLNILHYGDTLLRPSRYQETLRRYFVRTENDVRNERTNKQYLQLLQICIRYLKHLVSRGEKLHSGFGDGDQADYRRYLLPDGLVDCFEETVLFLMQATTSVVAIRNETGNWKHVPGKEIDDLKTPAVQIALEKLGKLGESAKASMTKAEKAIALAGLEDNTVGMGNAGPELLASLLLQNIGKRHPFEDRNMDVNQLYQECTSKLQYQINQFPRKRLLRTIHKLQEELSVVQLVNSWQQKTFTSFVQVLDPKTFETPTTDRENLYLPESECISDSLKSLQAKAVELEALEYRTQYLREQLKQSVEILEEDHGKAILVFTMITTIFLPLLILRNKLLWDEYVRHSKH
ncbi:hypothetical protein AG0111_0g1407 [Alternaria gaisen]|uniref:Uncharacterized protein n=1 Tax=Alternaria gaisen TaxID=167740 RepID=A0ACB6FYK9_9PLEO|nr:hypothetical protein AG0111_0g1407 [Alternaria gaisen]